MIESRNKQNKDKSTNEKHNSRDIKQFVQMKEKNNTAKKAKHPESQQKKDRSTNTPGNKDD